MREELLESFEIKKFQKDLLHWFERNSRDLPWRQDRDPYKIWVSEIMLQQTRVDTVIPYYQRFMERFPTLNDLAEADEDEVIKQWEGLGYYSRARNLHAGVREVREHYGGRVPDTVEQIRTIKGIGSYTAGAILSIAYGKPEPAVDGNVMRVLSRILCIEEDIQKAKTRKIFEDVIREIIARSNPSYFNQALMELGALICLPRSPKCLFCPVQSHCRAREMGIHENLPVKGKAKPPRVVKMAVAFIEHDGMFLVRKRPDKGLLAGLWELPNVEGDVSRLVQHIKEVHHLSSYPISSLMSHQHVFSHLQWEMDIYLFGLEGESSQQGGRWICWEDLGSLAFPVSYQKIFEKLKQK